MGNAAAFLEKEEKMDRQNNISLKKWMAEKHKLGVHEAWELLQPVMKELEKIHASGKYYGTISPDSLYCCNQVKTAYRLSKKQSGMLRETEGLGVFKPVENRSEIGIISGYSAPEQYHERGKKGAYTDVYALCALMYWMMTGTVPQDAFDRIFDDQVKGVSQMGAAVSAKQESMLMKGLAVRPKDRYEGIGQLKRAYEECLPVNKTQPVQSTPQTSEKFDAESCYQKGVNYYLGFGVAQDYNNAIYWLKFAADKGDDRAYYHLGLCYERTGQYGDHMYTRRKQAFEWFKKAALHKDARSHYKYKLAQCYELGFGTEVDMAEALKWYGEADKMGHARAKEMLEKLKGSTKTTSAEQHAEPVVKLKPSNIAEISVNRESAEVLYQKARSLKNGSWSKECVDLLRKAAEAGHAQAQYELASCCENGEGTSMSKTLAFYWYEKAANNPAAKANYKYKLGLCYSEGLGIGKSEENALIWYERAAEMGHTWAENKVVDYYLNASQAVQKTQKARSVLEKAGLNGNVKAQMKLGEYYHTGFGVSRNDTQAFNWYMKAANQGNPLAQLYIGDAYYFGNGTARNKAAAEPWYVKATMKNSPSAAIAWYRLGLCWKDNPGRHSQAEIRKCFERAAELGETAAKKYL